MPDKRGQGVGRLLLERLITSTEQAGIWTMQTGIFPENEPSIRLHEQVGFEVVGRRKRLGKLHGIWRRPPARAAQRRRRLAVHG